MKNLVEYTALPEMNSNQIQVGQQFPLRSAVTGH